MEATINATGERIAGQGTAACAEIGRKMGDANAVGGKLRCSARHVYRMADSGLMPWGVKIGSLRRWDLSEIDNWIVAGCPKVRGTRR